jgi:hypothetical protein
MKKALYLTGADTVVELDGPALRVSKPGSADRWFPLQRLSRVVSAQHVRWPSDALIACALGSITVSFLDKDGSLIARWIGRHPERLNGIDQRLSDLVESAEGMALYRQWLQGMENMALRSLQRRVGVEAGQTPSPAEMRRVFRGQAARMESLKAYDSLGRRLHELLVAWVTQELLGHGIACDQLILSGLDLPGDLAAILFWDYQMARLHWLGQRRRAHQPEEPPLAEIVQFFEGRDERNAHLLRGLLNRLNGWLAQT